MKLLVAALPIELTAFPQTIPGWARATTGPGKVKAAYGLTRVLDEAAAAGEQYEEIVVVGTAGSLVSDLPSGVHEIAQAFQHDVRDEAQVRGQHVSMPARIQTGRSGVVIATGDSFVDDPDEAETVRGLGGVLVDMETYVYVWVAQQYGIPIRVIRTVSDSAQDGAAQTWDESVVACSGVLWDWFRTEYEA